MKNRHWIMAAVAVTVAGAGTYYLISRPTDVSRAWSDVLESCVEDDVAGNTIFLGLSNTLGLGTTWKENPDGGYDVGRPWPDFPGRETLDTLGTMVPCSGQGFLSVELSGGVQQDLAGSAQATVASADSVYFETDGWAWDAIYLGLAEDWIRSGTSPEYRAGLERGELMAGRVLRLAGFRIVLRFSDQAAGEARQTFPPGVDASAAAKWVENNRLVLESTDTILVAAQLYRWNETEGLSSDDALEPAEVGDVARATDIEAPVWKR